MRFINFNIKIMTEEDKRMRDNIALVAMQCLINKKVKMSIWEKLESIFNKKIEFVHDPKEIAAEAYEYAKAMMEEREYIIRNEEEL